MLRPDLGFRLQLREPDLTGVNQQTRTLHQPPGYSQTNLCLALVSRLLSNKPAPGTSLPNNHQSGGKQKLTLWFGYLHQQQNSIIAPPDQLRASLEFSSLAFYFLENLAPLRAQGFIRDGGVAHDQT